MEKSAANRMSRLELYLKNMDLLKINPSVTVSGINLDFSEKADIHALLNTLNDWSIRKLFLFDPIETINPLINYFQNGGTNSILKDIKIFQNLNINPDNFIHTNRDNMDRLLHAKLFCTDNYNKRAKIWGEDVFYFYDLKPEIYTMYPEDKKLEVDIKYPEDVIAIYQWRYLESEDFQLKNCTDILNKLDKNKSTLKIRSTGEKFSKIIILRTCKIIYDDVPTYWLNFISPQNIQIAREAHELKLIEHGITKLDTVYDLNVLLTGMDFKIFPNLIYTQEKQSQLLTNQPIIDLTLKKYLSQPPDSKRAELELTTIYVNFIKEKFLSQFQTDKKLDIFFIDMDHPLVTFLIDAIPVIPRINAYRFLPGTDYTIRTMINTRKLVNTSYKIEKGTVQVAIDDLLSTDYSFNEKKYHADYLIVNGANQLNFNLTGDSINQSAKSVAQIKKWDPNYNAYSDWFAYLHQLNHFMQSGIRRPEALLIYPEYDEDPDLLYSIIYELQNTGLDYHIVDFETFNDHILCPVHDGEFILFNHNYRMLILPGINYIPIESMQKINKFFTEGGVIVALGRLPGNTLDHKKDALLQRIKKEVWMDESDTQSTIYKQHESGGLGYFQQNVKRLKNILTDLDRVLRIHIKSSNPGIIYQLREHQDNYFLMILNTDQIKTTNFNIESKYLGRPYCWDFDNAESYPYADWYIRDKKLILRLKLKPRESQLFIIDKKPALKMFQLYNSSLDGCRVIQQEENIFKLEGWQRKEGAGSITIMRSNEQKTLEYEIKKKLPMLTLGLTGWFMDSDHFKGQVSLGDQSYPFPYRSAVITYHKLIVIEKEYLDKQKLFLDLGILNDWCTLSINNKFVGKRIFSPWIFDVTGFIKAGENKISIQIANSLSNLFAENNSSSKTKFFVKSYGLFGPVVLIPYSIVNFTY